MIVVPTVDTVEEAIEARNWTYFPPLGRRSNGGGQAFDAAMWGSVPGGYRNTINDNIVLILMIETLEGLKNADAIAKVPGVTGIFAASGDLGNFTGFRQGTPDYERAINIVHDAAIKANMRLCGPFAWRDRPDFTLLPGGKRDGGDRARRRSGARTAREHAGQGRESDRLRRRQNPEVRDPEHAIADVVTMATSVTSGLGLRRATFSGSPGSK